MDTLLDNLLLFLKKPEHQDPDQDDQKNGPQYGSLAF